MRTININDIGPFFESGRRQGTPPDDDYRELMRCQGCWKILPADLVNQYRGEWLCDKCRVAAMDVDDTDDE